MGRQGRYRAATDIGRIGLRSLRCKICERKYAESQEDGALLLWISSYFVLKVGPGHVSRSSATGTETYKSASTFSNAPTLFLPIVNMCIVGRCLQLSHPELQLEAKIS